MSLNELLSHPDPVFHGIPLDQLPPDAMEAYFWLLYQDACRDQGVPEHQILSFEAWKDGIDG